MTTNTTTQNLVTIDEGTFSFRLVGNPDNPYVKMLKEMPADEFDGFMRVYLPAAIDTCLRLGNAGFSFLRLERTE